MVMHTHIVILNKIKPSSLTEIQVFLGEYILKAIMVSEPIYMNTIQVVSADLEWKYHCCKLEVMSWIVLLVHLKLCRSISYNLIKTGVVVNLVFNCAMLFS